MKITFTLDAATSARLIRLLAFLEIPSTALPEMAKEHLRSVSDAREDVFIAEGYIYPDRSTAKRAAAKLLALYPGQSQMQLQYRSRDRVLCEDFQSSAGRIADVFPFVSRERVSFNAALLRDHMEKIGALLAMLEIPPNEIQKTFRRTLESEAWHDDWRNWTGGYVYPDQKAATRVAKRIAKRFPADRGDIRLTFLNDGTNAIETFSQTQRKGA